MPLKLTRVEYMKLKPREQESYNFQKLSAILADFGYRTIKLSDDWQGADFIAQHMENKTFLKVQLKSRLSFDKEYRGKDLYLAFPFEKSWFLIPHDEFLDQVLVTFPRLLHQSQGS
ncbi:MAG: hypothetical protein ACRD5H_07170 [Nitrososphaerales archaeon]